MNERGGLLEIIIGVFVVILVLVAFMQPVSILTDLANDSINGAGSTPKFGTNSDGNIVEVGPSIALPDLTVGLLSIIGLVIIIGFIVWIIRFGRGGIQNEPDGF